MVSNESMQHKIFQGNYVDAFSLFDRVQLIDVGGYDTSYHALEDFEMWLHLATNGRRIVFVPAVLGYYYILPGSMIELDARQEALFKRMQRIFNQVKARQFLDLNTCSLRYHPELGYI